MRAAGPSGAVGDWDGWVLYGSFRWKHPKHIAELCRRPFRGISPRPSKALCTRLQLTNPAQHAATMRMRSTFCSTNAGDWGRQWARQKLCRRRPQGNTRTDVVVT